MNITDIKLTLWEDRGQQTKVRAYCSLVFDYQFVVHDVKVIEGLKGLYVVMPSRRLQDSCPGCKAKTAYLDHYCGACGSRLAALENRQLEFDERGRRKVFVDVAHPVNQACRADIDAAVLARYHQESGKRQAAHGSVVCSGQVNAGWVPVTVLDGRVVSSGSVFCSGGLVW